jgi:PAS domain S-box-containing protein
LLFSPLHAVKNNLTLGIQVSPVGMYSIDTAGLILEANPRYWEMTGHPKDKVFAMSWMSTLHDDSVEESKEGWRKLTVEHIPWTAELVSIDGS